ncbi:hypothetical protein BASA81_001625 [Batrachochytrium salamandrivorans]|nr:hypothetical protein BASA81_001625 [Batrachochytrium salamandrivorans]
MRSFLLQALLLAVVAMMGGANAAQCPSSDIIWVLDSSSSVLANPSATAELTDFLAKFTSKVDPTSTRQGFVEYAGPYFRLPGSDTILSSFALSHNQTGFISALDGLSPVGGTTNTASALDFVHATFLAENRTVASRHTIVVLASDGSPTDVYGDDTAEAEQLASLAAQRLTQLPNVELAFLRLGEFHYRPNFLLQEANYVYLSQYERLSALLKDEFLCVAPPPKCRYPSPMEIIWVLDGSSSMVESSGSFSNVTNFIADFTERLDPQAVVRQGFLEYGGAYADDPQFGTVIDALNTTSDMNLFLSRLEALTAVGGTTNTADAIDYVLNVMLAGQAPNPNRFVILATDGNPSDMFGETTNDTVAAAEQAAARIRQVAGATFVFLRFGQHNYYPGFLEGTADHIYDADYVRLRRLFAQNFLCATDSPSTSPTTQPTLVPTNQPTLAPTGQPTVSPTGQPTKQPTLPPTGQPTLPPTGQPTLTPTSQPTVAPIDQPTLVPTTRGPTKKPSTPAPVKSSTILQPSLSSVPTAPPTLAPIETASPVYSPSMAPIVTQSPIATLAPVFAPSQVPTVCVPGVVSCCISMFVNLVAMYVNEVDITSSIQGDLNNQTTNKFVQFPEPSHDAVIGFKGYEARETYVGTLAIRCSCTRPEATGTLQART